MLWLLLTLRLKVIYKIARSYLSYLIFYEVFMKYLKNLLLSLNEIFVVMIIQYILLIIVILIFGIYNSIILGSIILLLFETVYILLKSKKIHRFSSNTIYFPYVLLGISIAVIYNMIIFKLGIKFDVNTSIPIILNIICSSIVGPIFEELLFRYSLIEKLEKFNSKRNIVIISSLIFGLFHKNVITMIYAFIIGVINSYFYLKERNIFIPIIIHMSGNIIASYLFDYNIWIFILGIILLIISFLIIKGENYE